MEETRFKTEERDNPGSVVDIYLKGSSPIGDSHGWIAYEAPDSNNQNALYCVQHASPETRAVILSRMRKQIQRFLPADILGTDVSGKIMDVMRHAVDTQLDKLGIVTLTSNLHGLPVPIRIHLIIAKVPNTTGAVAEMAVGLGDKVDYMETCFPINHMEAVKH